MREHIAYFEQVVHTSISNFMKVECDYRDIREIQHPDMTVLRNVLYGYDISIEEYIVFLLALMPHISPASLDTFFIQNKAIDRPYTEFGGWKASIHGGFMPTGETAMLLLSGGDIELRAKVRRIFDKDHWFYRNNIIRLEGQVDGEPYLSGKLCITDEALSKLFNDGTYTPDYSISFPAKRIATPLEWGDLVAPFNLKEELANVLLWAAHHRDIRDRWQLDRIVKPGYRLMFYGPPGTGKTLTAMLIGKRTGMDVYRVDLSMIVSKYIGETEKNMAKIFDRAEHQNWILFFDEADALFGQRTETQSSNDRHANQEVAYLLQRIEDFPGMVIIATNLKDNVDEAFFRRFQSTLYFPMPDENLRRELLEKMIPASWLGESSEEIIHEASRFTLSGGSMVNVIQSCAITMYANKLSTLSMDILIESVKKELTKDGKITGN